MKTRKVISRPLDPTNPHACLESRIIGAVYVQQGGPKLVQVNVAPLTLAYLQHWYLSCTIGAACETIHGVKLGINTELLQGELQFEYEDKDG